MTLKLKVNGHKTIAFVALPIYRAHLEYQSHPHAKSEFHPSCHFLRYCLGRKCDNDTEHTCPPT